jgi:hypothetical protein
MKFKVLLGVIATAVTLGAALPAAAHDNDRRGGWDRGYRQEITVRTQRGEISVDQRDRLFHQLTDRPYRFRPGFTYVYTDRCNRGGCMVLELAGGGRGRLVDRFFAPYISRHVDFRAHDGRWDRDNREWRGNDRDWRDGRDMRRSESREWRGEDDRGDYRDDRRDDRREDDRRLEGGPRGR